MNRSIRKIIRQRHEAHRGLDPVTTKRNQSLLEHLGLAHLAARRQANKGREDFDDLLQESRIGVLTAIERFDPSRGCQPSSYLISRATGQILHYRRDRAECFRIPWRLRDLTAKCARLQQEQEAIGKSRLSEQELAVKLGVSTERLRQAQEAVRMARLGRLDQNSDSRGEQTASCQLEQLEQPEVVQDHQRDWLLKVFNDLEPNQQEWLRGYFIERMSLVSMSRCFGVSRARIKSGIQDAVKQLQRWARRDGELLPATWQVLRPATSARHSRAHC